MFTALTFPVLCFIDVIPHDITISDVEQRHSGNYFLVAQCQVDGDEIINDLISIEKSM